VDGYVLMFQRTLKLYPKGDSEADDKLSQHLHLADGETLSKGELIFVRVNLQAAWIQSP